MALNPATALDRKLKWTDFKTQQMTPPSPGQVMKSAATMPVYGHGPLSCDPVPKSKPTTYKTGKTNVAISLDPSSWVADFVFTWPQTNQDALLDHEQQHYMIGALSGRDMHDDINALNSKTYSSASDGIADLQAVLAVYSAAETQKIQDKYDADTKHDPVGHATEQANWNKAIADAKTNKKKLLDALKAAKLFP